MVDLMLILPVFWVLAVFDSVIFPRNKMSGPTWNVQESCHCHRLGSLAR